MTDILIQILLVVAIVAVVFLIVVLWRWNNVLIDVKDTTSVVRKRAHEFDSWISSTENTIKDFISSFKSFLGAFEQIKKIKNKMAEYIDDSDSKTNKAKEAIQKATAENESDSTETIKKK